VLELLSVRTWAWLATVAGCHHHAWRPSLWSSQAADRIAERARGFVEQAKPLEALHLIDVALTASPDSEICREVKRAALQLLDKQTGGKNLWERMSIATELRTLDE